ncbi:MAG: hypothetical protein LLF94_11470 [Chlamydiales bacterium]|nr:hypothetical protein [Chlamydiales bacterium]
MEAQRSWPSNKSLNNYPNQTRVVEPPPTDLKRSREGPQIDRTTALLVEKKIKPEQPEFFQPDEDEVQPEILPISRKRDREATKEADDTGLDATLAKLERIGLQERFGNADMTSRERLVRMSHDGVLSISINPNNPLIDLSDEEFRSVVTRLPRFSFLIVENSFTITNAGFIPALLGKSDLHSLRVSDCRGFDDWTLQNLATSCPNLLRLTLLTLSITDEGICNLVTKCKQLEVLNLDWCYNLSSRTMYAIGKHCPNLREFSISQCSEYTVDGFKAMLAGCPNLKVLELWSCKTVDDEWIDALCNSKCELVTLDIFRCHKVTDAAISRLKARFPSLNLIQKAMHPCLK